MRSDSCYNDCMPKYTISPELYSSRRIGNYIIPSGSPGSGAVTRPEHQIPDIERCSTGTTASGSAAGWCTGWCTGWAVYQGGIRARIARIVRIAIIARMTTLSPLLTFARFRTSQRGFQAVFYATFRPAGGSRAVFYATFRPAGGPGAGLGDRQGSPAGGV